MDNCKITKNFTFKNKEPVIQHKSQSKPNLKENSPPESPQFESISSKKSKENGSNTDKIRQFYSNQKDRPDLRSHKPVTLKERQLEWGERWEIYFITNLNPSSPPKYGY